MRLTHHPAMLHDNNVGIERSWWRVSWRRGKRPLKVTHWAGSSARVPIHCDLSLRETKQYPIKLHTKPSDCHPKQKWCKTVIHATITSCQVPSHNGICTHWNTKLITRGAECVPYIPCTSPRFSPCMCRLWSMLKSWEGDRKTMVKATKMAQTRSAEVWQQYKMKMAVKVPLVVWQRLPATDHSLQETYSLNAHAQALLILMGTSVQTEGKSLIKTS